MRLAKKTVLVLIAVLVLVSVCFTLYTLRAHTIAGRYIYEGADGGITWRTAPSGSLFPWPNESGMLQILSEMSDIDLFIYVYLIKSWTLVGVTILLWAVTCLCVFKAVRRWGA